MKSHTKVAIIGGGIMGVSLLYHLIKEGWNDIVLVEWADLIPDILPEDTIFIKFEHYNNKSRKIYII